jgi:hypothetical protein
VPDAYDVLLGLDEYGKVKATPKPKDYIYLLTIEGCWDYEQSLDHKIFKEFKPALESFQNEMKNAKADLREWVSTEDDLDEDEQIRICEEFAYYEGYETGEFSKLHCLVRLERKEVM